MKTYKVGELMVAIIDGQLWQRVEDIDGDDEEIEDEQDEPVVHAKKKTRKSRGVLLSDAQKDEIRQKFSAGASKEKLAKEYKVSIASIYNFTRIKPLVERTKDKPVNDYTCVNGHEFKSKLEPGAVICPTCHSNDCDLGTLNGPVNDYV